MAKAKFYTVWVGGVPGVYNNWADCEDQILGFPKACYKSFPTLAEAEEAFNNGKPLSTYKIVSQNDITVILPSIAIGASCHAKTLEAKYQGVDVANGNVLFTVGPLAEGNAFIAAFLGVVHALAYCKQHDLSSAIYTNTDVCLSWINKKAIKSNLEKTDHNIKLFELIERATTWLNTNTYTNQVLLWHASELGKFAGSFNEEE